MRHKPDISRTRQSNPEELMAAWDSLLYTLGQPAASASLPSMSAPDPVNLPLPVTVLSGFLGAGKTTLLCQLLEQTNLQVLAIVNDVASVNIDAALIRDRSAETIALQNGCACCVLGGDLYDTLTEIGTRTTQPDIIVIEASGIADPMGIAQSVAQNPATTLDGIVTVVDASTFDARISDTLSAPMLERQLNAAFLIALSKCADDQRVNELREKIACIAPGRPVLSLHDVKHKVVDIVLGASLRGARPTPAAIKHRYTGFTDTVISWPAPLDAEAFFQLLENMPDSVYRLKGWIALGQDQQIENWDVQAAGPAWRVTPRSQRPVPAQLVAIGRANTESFKEFCNKLQALPAAYL